MTNGSHEGALQQLNEIRSALLRVNLCSLCTQNGNKKKNKKRHGTLIDSCKNSYLTTGAFFWKRQQIAMHCYLRVGRLLPAIPD